MATLKEQPKFEELRQRRGASGVSRDEWNAELTALTNAMDRLHIAALFSVGADLIGPPDFTPGLLLTANAATFQLAHMDFPEHLVCQQFHDPKRGDHKKMVPYVMELPVYSSGMEIEMWPDLDFADCITSGKKEPGSVVRVPLGYALLFRGDVIHAGGFLVNFKRTTMSQRWHFYLYPPGIPRDTTYVTRYKSQLLAQDRYYDEVCVTSRQERLMQA